VVVLDSGPSADLAEIAAQLEPDAVRVLAFIARRLLAGQRAYGRLDIATDRRDWRKERAEELADAFVYGAIAEIQAATKGSV
jgi:hypothetical protein